MTMYYSEARALMDSARNPGNGKPLQNNTRLYERTVRDPRNCNRTIPVYAVQLHYTDVVTIYPDFWELRSGGWHTPTTQDRLNGYAPGGVYSNYRGDGWMLPIQNPSPEPARGERTIPHPFNATDPGPEPVKSSEDCIAGTKVELPFQALARWHDWDFRNDPAPSDPNALFHMTARYYPDGSGPCIFKHVAGIERVEYGEEGYRWHHTPGAGWEYKQCPHCLAFDQLHEQWRFGMYGSSWGRRRGKGWEVYSKMMEAYGSREEWLEAAREDLREVKADNATWREWYNANHVPFFEGVRVDHSGHVLRSQAEDYFKRQRRRARDEARHQRALEAHERHQRYLERLKSGYAQRHAARQPRFERLAAEIANDIRDVRIVLNTNASLEVEQNAG